MEILNNGEGIGKNINLLSQVKTEPCCHLEIVFPLGKTQDVTSDRGVTLLTAHMSKGLQFEVVFVVGLCEGTFPDYRAVAGNKRQWNKKKIICLLQY